MGQLGGTLSGTVNQTIIVHAVARIAGEVVGAMTVTGPTTVLWGVCQPANYHDKAEAGTLKAFFCTDDGQCRALHSERGHGTDLVEVRRNRGGLDQISYYGWGTSEEEERRALGAIIRPHHHARPQRL